MSQRQHNPCPCAWRSAWQEGLSTLRETTDGTAHSRMPTLFRYLFSCPQGGPSGEFCHRLAAEEGLFFLSPLNIFNKSFKRKDNRVYIFILQMNFISSSILIFT